MDRPTIAKSAEAKARTADAKLRLIAVAAIVATFVLLVLGNVFSFEAARNAKTAATSTHELVVKQRHSIRQGNQVLRNVRTGERQNTAELQQLVDLLFPGSGVVVGQGEAPAPSSAAQPAQQKQPHHSHKAKHHRQPPSEKPVPEPSPTCVVLNICI